MSESNRAEFNVASKAQLDLIAQVIENLQDAELIGTDGLHVGCECLSCKLQPEFEKIITEGVEAIVSAKGMEYREMYLFFADHITDKDYLKYAYQRSVDDISITKVLLSTALVNLFSRQLATAVLKNEFFADKIN